MGFRVWVLLVRVFLWRLTNPGLWFSGSAPSSASPSIKAKSRKSKTLNPKPLNPKGSRVPLRVQFLEGLYPDSREDPKNRSLNGGSYKVLVYKAPN